MLLLMMVMAMMKDEREAKMRKREKLSEIEYRRERKKIVTPFNLKS